MEFYVGSPYPRALTLSNLLHLCYENLIDGELDNRTPGKVTGWMHFFRKDEVPLRVTFDLEGDFHEDIRGTVIRLSNPNPSERHPDREKTYMDGLLRYRPASGPYITAGLPLGPWTEALAQDLMKRNELFWEEQGIRGTERETRRQEFSERYRAHIAGGDLYYPYVAYPYIEWYSDNGRVVLELDPSQVEVVKVTVPVKEKTPADLVQDAKRREAALGSFMGKMLEDLSRENRKRGGDGNVTASWLREVFTPGLAPRRVGAAQKRKIGAGSRWNKKFGVDSKFDR